MSLALILLLFLAEAFLGAYLGYRWAMMSPALDKKLQESYDRGYNAAMTFYRNATSK